MQRCTLAECKAACSAARISQHGISQIASRAPKRASQCSSHKHRHPQLFSLCESESESEANLCVEVYCESNALCT